MPLVIGDNISSSAGSGVVNFGLREVGGLGGRVAGWPLLLLLLCPTAGALCACAVPSEAGNE